MHIPKEVQANLDSPVIAACYEKLLLVGGSKCQIVHTAIMSFDLDIRSWCNKYAQHANIGQIREMSIIPPVVA